MPPIVTRRIAQAGGPPWLWRRRPRSSDDPVPNVDRRMRGSQVRDAPDLEGARWAFSKNPRRRAVLTRAAVGLTLPGRASWTTSGSVAGPIIGVRVVRPRGQV